MTLLAVGDMADKLVSWSAFTTSVDGETWTPPVQPFEDRCKAVGIAAGLDRYVAISDNGRVSNSIDGVSWEKYQIIQGNMSPTCVTFGNGLFAMCGQRKFLEDEGPYTALDEAAQILINNTGDNWNWRLIYSNYDYAESRFYSIKHIEEGPIPLWVALGSAQNKPFGIYSIDNCVTWNEIIFPDLNSIKYAYDILWNFDRYYITVNGMILNTLSIENPEWGASQILKVPFSSVDLIRIEKNPAGHMVAVCSGGLFYSLDRTGWNLISQPIYRFKSIIWYEGMWVAGADSNLTTYTYWTSTDTIIWTPYYQPVQIYGFAKI